MSSIVVSFRITPEQHNKMLIESNRLDISSTEWVLRQLAYAEHKSENISVLITKLNSLRRYMRFHDYSDESYNRVVEVLNFVNENL